MSKRNAHDVRCAQDIHRIIRDGDAGEAISTPRFTPGVVRVRDGETTRVTKTRRTSFPTASEVRERLGLPPR